MIANVNPIIYVIEKNRVNGYSVEKKLICAECLLTAFGLCDVRGERGPTEESEASKEQAKAYCIFREVTFLVF